MAKSREEAARSVMNSTQQLNMIGEGTVMEGTLTAEGDLRVSGKVIGTLKISGKLIVAQEGNVEGVIEAVQMDVAGRVNAEVSVSERLILRGTSVLQGNIKTGRLVIEEGAVFEGNCLMGSSQTRFTSLSGEDGTAGGVPSVTVNS